VAAAVVVVHIFNAFLKRQSYLRLLLQQLRLVETPAQLQGVVEAQQHLDRLLTLLAALAVAVAL
jgi:hypothetical protein